MRKGFTLLETVFAVAVFGLVIGMTMGSWLLFMYKSNRVNTQASLDMDVRKVIERFRSEIRGTARETIIFYPENQEPYQAVAFALAGAGTNGLVEMTAGGSNILWRQTVVYHVWNHSPHQMRRTVFSNRYADALYADRYSQIGTVVTTGDGSGACLAGESAQTEVMFENLFTGKLWHAEAKFDGYAPAANTRERITFGSLPLGPGSHTVSFTVSGKNPAATGYALRLDQVAASVGAWPLEAEQRVTSGASAAPFYVGQGLAGAAYGLTAAVSGLGSTLSMTVENDAIEECVFISEGRNVTFSNTVVRFDTEIQPTGFPEGVYAAKLDGQFGSLKNWSCAEQTAGSRDDYYYPTNCFIRIPVMADPNRTTGGEPVLYGFKKDGFGPVFRLYKSLYNTGLVLHNPSFAVVDQMEVPSYNSDLQPKLDPNALVPLEFWQDGSKKSDWAACVKQKYVDLRPARLVSIPMGSTLMLQFRVAVSTYKTDCFTRFPMSRYDKPGVRLPGCWMVPAAAGNSNLLSVANWTGVSGLVQENLVPTIENVAVNFADDGDYVSHVFDTRSAAGEAKTLTWVADVPAGSSLTMYARSGDALAEDGFGISDAAAWEYVPAAANGSVFSGSTGRYVQFRTVFTAQPASQYPGLGGIGSAGPYCSGTPRLRRVCFNWDGEEKYVDVTADLLKSPDCGIFEVKVDGKPLVRGVTMEIEIFKEIVTQGGVMKERMRSAMTAEVEPRNSGK